MKKNKGFTLIELLAVIVVLGVIALIATPIVLDIIEEAEEKAGLRTAGFYLDAVEIALADKIYASGAISDGTYDILNSGDICLEKSGSNCINTLEVKVKGQRPKQGTVTISDSTIISASIFVNGKEAVYDYTGELAYAKTLDEICKFKEGTKGEISAKYECKVDPNREPYTFYILSYLDENGNIVTDKSQAVSVNLILNSNIRIDGIKVSNKEGAVAWASADYVKTYITEAGGNLKKGYYNLHGPVTAMAYLEEATKSWTNTNKIKTTTFTNTTGEEFAMAQSYIANARLPYYSEVEVKKSWLINNLDSTGVSGVHGYWTSAKADDIWSAMYVHHSSGVIGMGALLNDTNPYIGVRPVVNLKF